MNIWIFLVIFYGISLLGCSIGFKKFVYFLSIGYGFSVALLGISYFVYSTINSIYDPITIVQCLLFIIYGIRLSLFLLIREIKNSNYRKVLNDEIKMEKKIPLFVSFSIWISVSALYVMQTSPVFFRIFNGATWTIGEDLNLNNILLPSIGACISLIGIIIEAIADKEKSNQKKINNNMVATKGLYKIVRCPNYFGEILFWTGVFIGGILVYNSNALQWIVSSLGWICIIYIMINGSQRLDRRQEKKYGSLDNYRSYADHTPLILPLLPIYHIGKYKPEDLNCNR